MNYDFDKRSKDSAIFFSDESLTRQEFVSQCNINNVIKKYTKHSNLSSLIITQDAKYGDFSNIPSHQDAYNLVMAAEEHFKRLPANIRSRFGNDPSQLLDFIGDPQNRSEAVQLGLIVSDQKLINNFENKNSSPQAKPIVAEGNSSS